MPIRRARGGSRTTPAKTITRVSASESIAY
jgi:hypothetical protein